VRDGKLHDVDTAAYLSGAAQPAPPDEVLLPWQLAQR
jgi:hypothetical protein